MPCIYDDRNATSTQNPPQFCEDASLVLRANVLNNMIAVTASTEFVQKGSDLKSPCTKTPLVPSFFFAKQRALKVLALSA
jgi:hypothetical protein